MAEGSTTVKPGQVRQGQCLDIVLPGIAALSACLNIFNIWKDQYSNTYYTAAVISMLQSWHNFFYASFDPAGYITVDKPPVTFWVQALFARVFGVHGWSVILPQALAGVGSVLLVYYLVKPAFGKTAARLASLVMACSPIAVAVSRTNNIDSMLVFTLLLATWMLFRGCRVWRAPSGRGGDIRKALWVIGAFALIGVGFNMKMFQAYMVVPAFYLFYLLAFRDDWRKKLAILAAATVVLAGVTVSWSAIVDATPQANRPYIGGSRTNSVLELALGYNGIQRLEGMGGGPGGGGSPRPQMQNDGEKIATGATTADQTLPATTATRNSASNTAGELKEEPGQAPEAAGSISPGQKPPSSGGGFQGQAPPSGGGPQGPGSGGRSPQGQGPDGGDGGLQGRVRGGGAFGTGYPGPLRLFQSELSGQISWLLPFVGFACLALLAGIRRRRPLTAKQEEALFWLGWLLPGMVFFSVAGFYHQYYLIMLAPPIAALTGAGWAELWNQYRCRDGWKMWLLPSALLATTVFEMYILQPYWKQIGWEWPVGIGAVGIAMTMALVLVIALERMRLAYIRLVAGLAMAGMLVLLVAPLYWSTTPLLYGVNSTMPQAGPGEGGEFGRGPGGTPAMAGPDAGGNGGMNSGAGDKLLEYVTKNNTGEPCLFATTDSQTAASYIISGKPVVALGGFSGGDNTLTKLEQMVKDRKIKFFLIPSGSGFGGGGGSSDVVSWIRSHSTEVPRQEWQTGSHQNNSGGMGEAETLYEINSEATPS